MSVQFVKGSLWTESLSKAMQDTPGVENKVTDFIKTKQNNPLEPFGAKDQHFTSGGVYKKALPKARKAHLTQDLSIVYELSGKNPTVVKLIGVFSHAQLGTGQPANIKKQKQMARKLSELEQNHTNSHTG